MCTLTFTWHFLFFGSTFSKDTNDILPKFIPKLLNYFLHLSNNKIKFPAIKWEEKIYMYITVPKKPECRRLNTI